MTTRPSARRGAIDIARSTSLLLVVVAHLVMVVLDRDADDALRGVNLFQLYPQFEWLTMLSPMPLFFVASGWANARSDPGSRAGRASVLVALATVVAVSWSLASLTERTVTGQNGIVSDGARIATQPLWFLTAWVPFTVGAGLLNRAARRIVPTLVACASALVVVDIWRFVGGAPRWVGFPTFFAAWAVPWVMGAWWRQRHDVAAFDETRTGLSIAVGAVGCAVLLVAFFGYHAALIDAVPGHRSNTTPPTLFTVVASLAQVGLFIAAATRLDRLAARGAGSIRRLDALAPGLYVWHLTALSLCGALLAAGVWTPDRLSRAWWLSRPAWFGVVLALALLFSLATRRALAPLRSVASGQSAHRPALVGVATVAGTVSFGLIGLWGPDTTGMATVVVVLCLASAGGFLLAARPARRVAS